MINLTNFSEYTYSKKKHFATLTERYLKDRDFPYRDVDIKCCNLKVYQDLLVINYIRDNFPLGSKICEIGGGDSRVIKYLKKHYVFYNVDKLEGLGSGPQYLQIEGFTLIKDYIGNFNKLLKDNYFDLVFSISALEHVPQNQETFDNIFADIQRVLKPRGHSLHAFDIVIKESYVWTNPILLYLFSLSNPVNSFIAFDDMLKDKDLYTMSEEIYNRDWKPITNKSYDDFGKPLSYNILWQK